MDGSLNRKIVTTFTGTHDGMASASRHLDLPRTCFQSSLCNTHHRWRIGFIRGGPCTDGEKTLVHGLSAKFANNVVCLNSVGAKKCAKVVRRDASAGRILRTSRVMEAPSQFFLPQLVERVTNVVTVLLFFNSAGSETPSNGRGCSRENPGRDSEIRPRGNC